MRPIRSLARSASQIGEADLDLRLARRAWATEFAPLASALDAMAHRLAAREAELPVANSHLDALSRIDGLTALANRRGFDAALDTQWTQSQRPLLMIDVDDFKLFNDHDGHVEGDHCLRRVGAVIAAAAEAAADLAARYGGRNSPCCFPAVTERPRWRLAPRCGARSRISRSLTP